jgi:hypothetical protein
VPTNGGAVTRDIDYQLEYQEYGMSTPIALHQGVVWEHLTGNLPNTGANSPSGGPPGTFEDEQSVVNMSGVAQMSVTQSFSVTLNGVSIGLGVPGFNGEPSLYILKYEGYISINGNIGGQVNSRTGRLIPGTYTPCP